MSGFEVLGAPDPGLPRRYRGTSRSSPTVLEHLGLDHPANRTLLKILDRDDFDGRVEDVVTARRLARAYATVPEVGSLEIVEIVNHGERPRAGNRLLGFDVQEGMQSLLASILLWDDPSSDTSGPGVTDARVIGLRTRFADRLNDRLLFDTEALAIEFLDASTELGPWEGPEIEWEVVGLWTVPPRDSDRVGI